MKFDTISGLRVTHKVADIDDIESLSFGTETEIAERLVENNTVSEAFILHTCHRAEIYVATDEQCTGHDVLRTFASHVSDDAVVTTGHEESLRHLLRVAAGLESMILGEEEILGQMQDAYQAAREAGTLGPLLDTAVMKAIHVGQDARTETAISEGVHSISNVAIKLAARETDLSGSTVLLVGAGSMGTDVGRTVDDTDAERLIVANRTYSRAKELTSGLETVATDVIELDALPAALDEADVVVTATCADDYVVDSEHTEPAQEGVIVDIAQPRDVAPGTTANTGWVSRDLADLKAVINETQLRRRRAAQEVEAIVDRECDRLHEQFKQCHVEEVISSIHSHADRVKSKNLETALSKLDANGGLTEEQRYIVESFADAMVSELLAPPTRSLKEAAVYDEWSTIQAAVHLFDPSADAGTTLLDGTVRMKDDPNGPQMTSGLEND
ncbi:glutamyl-tRNA reductase [Haloterrigena alkaliphila]|uniref:Glutamyl-tRNA reductase n=1 Tax=Haloterrigena alkaliphila TaxID=2816475 RepID=A0A8A2VA59_9EURY|nr:glutamyl-tRNA reductase [Haloterrigena alkaliphila]QSW97610.1 glutamyl-tRNA reductase [Haloterrigena alkaliphila]